MNLIITKSSNEKSWYKDSIGQSFEVIEPPTWAREGDEEGVYYVKHFENSTGQALFVWKEDCELDLPQAIETTEILNGVKADKGILTEEELKERNRLLVLENDKLNIREFKCKAAVDKCGLAGNSLASVIIGYDLPNGWRDWSKVEANDFMHGLYDRNSNMAYERYEIWLAWKSIREAYQSLEETK